MLWIVRLAVCASLALASASEAHGGPLAEGDAAATALRTTPGHSGKAALNEEQRRALLGLPLDGGVAVVRPSVRGRMGLSGLGEASIRAAAAEQAEARGGLGLIDEGPGDRPGLSFAFNKRVSLGLSYERVTDEDMMFEVAETGSLKGDYDSHNVFLQARWEF